MMPYCQYRRCKRVAEEKFGVVKEYHHPYLCLPHLKRVLKMLGIDYKEDGDYR